MATANPTINPILTTTALGSFNTSSAGFIQGTALNDPAVRNALAGGILATSETLPMWGGVGVYLQVPGLSGGPLPNLGPILGRASTLTLTSSTGLAGFSVFDQDHSMFNTPQSQVPLAGSSMGVNYYPLGSGARIAVNCDPALALLMEGGSVGQQVSWDFNDQILQEYVASGATEAVTSMTWSATNGGQVAVVMAGASVYGLGDTINVSGVTNTGTGALALINKSQVINTWTDTTHFTFLLPGTSTLWGTLAGTIVLNVGVGALACRVLDVNIGNSMTVVYDPATGFATWNRAGTTAVIQI